MTNSIPGLIYMGILMSMLLMGCGSASKSGPGVESDPDVTTTQPSAMTPSESGQTEEVELKGMVENVDGNGYYGAITDIVRIPTIDVSAEQVQAPGESELEY